MKYKKYIIIVCILVIFFGLSGCQQLRDDLADLLSPPTDAQMAARMADMTAAGKSVEAIQTGEKFLAAHQGPSFNVHAKLVQLYLEQGDSVRAQVHLEGANSAPIGAGVAPAPGPDAVAEPLAPPAVSAKVGPDGLEASAGNAKASIK
jgi:hypothetical protein